MIGYVIVSPDNLKLYKLVNVSSAEENKECFTPESSLTMRSQIVNVPIPNQHSEVEEAGFGTVAYPSTMDEDKAIIQPSNQDAFGNEEFAEVKYKVLKWWYAVA